MPKDREPIEAPIAGVLAPISPKIRFEDCDFTPQETERLLAVGTTTLFDKLIRNGELESYFEGTRRKITGRSILAYRERKLAEASGQGAIGVRASEQLRKSRVEKKAEKLRGNRKAGAP